MPLPFVHRRCGLLLLVHRRRRHGVVRYHTATEVNGIDHPLTTAFADSRCHELIRRHTHWELFVLKVHQNHSGTAVSGERHHTHTLHALRLHYAVVQPHRTPPTSQGELTAQTL